MAAIDLVSKRNVYRRNGVQEYLVWQTFENRFSWFRLQAEEFVLIEPDRFCHQSWAKYSEILLSAGFVQKNGLVQ